MELGVPRERGEKVLALILEGAQEVGFLTDIKGKSYVDLRGSQTTVITSTEADDVDRESSTESSALLLRNSGLQNTERKTSGEQEKKVFVTHGKNREFLEPIKQLLGFGGMTPIISVERTSVSKPVPDKVMEDMRSCGAAIIHVDGDEKLIDGEAKERIILNSNVLIEIGAAMALFGRRFILLVREGVQLPSNLQGLFEVRYKGDKLDGDTTLKLLGAINDIKNNPLPSRQNDSVPTSVV